jgi:hypothetical protein
MFSIEALIRKIATWIERRSETFSGSSDTNQGQWRSHAARQFSLSMQIQNYYRYSLALEIDCFHHQ